MKHLKKTFIDINGYPKWIFEQVEKDIQDNRGQPIQEQIEPLNVQNNQSGTSIILPYQDEQGDKLIKNVTKMLTKINGNHVTKVIYTGRKLGTNFTVKDRTKMNHEHNLIYKVTCTEPTCKATYIGKVSRWLSERIKDHSGRDHKSNAMETGHTNVAKENFKSLQKTKD